MSVTELFVEIVGSSMIIDEVSDVSETDEVLVDEVMEGTMRSEMLLKSAHDLGGSLASIKMFLQLISQGAVSSKDNDVLEHLLKKVEYMDHLVQDIFFLSKMETNQLQFSFQKVSVGSWINDVVSYFSKDLSALGMELCLGEKAGAMIDKPNTCGWLHIDENRINQVLYNYFDNAIKYSTEGNNKIELEVYVTQLPESDKGELVLMITDHGVGMNKKEQLRVFDKYYSINKNGKNGSGLGLAIAREIVRKHHGQVGVDSQPDNGSKFSIILPVEYQEA